MYCSFVSSRRSFLFCLVYLIIGPEVYGQMSIPPSFSSFLAIFFIFVSVFLFGIPEVIITLSKFLSQKSDCENMSSFMK